MWRRVRSALRRLLLSPGRRETPTPTPPEAQAQPQPQARPGRKRPRRSTQSSGDQDGRPWKRLKMGELVEAVKTTAQGAWNTTGTVLSWLRSGTPPPGDLPTPSHSPSLSLSPSPLEPGRSRWGPLTALTPTQDLPSSLGEPFVCRSGEEGWTPLARPARSLQLLPREGTLLESGDEACLMKRPLHSPRALRTVNGHSRSGLALPRYRGRAGPQLSAWRPPRTPTPDPSPGPPHPPQSQPLFVPMYAKTFSGRGSLERPAGRSPPTRHPGGHGRSSRKYFSTVEETIRREEKEVYRQLLDMVASGHSSRSLTIPVSSPLTHRVLPRVLGPRERGSPQVLSLEESGGAGEPLAGEPAPCHLSWADPPSGLPDASETRLSASPQLTEETPGADTMSTGSDSESVIVVKVKEAPRRESERMPKFDAVLWIRELTSMYDSRARERRRLIEEQEVLAERLRQQRLQDKETLSTRATSPLQLTVPLVEEVPIADIPRRELEHEEDRAGLQEEEEEEEFPELTEEMQAEVYRAFRPGNPDEVLSEGFRLTLTRKDVHTLSHLNWLNDEVINFYMNLLVERSRAPSLPTVHAFNTFFYPKVKSDGYVAVKRWTKKVDVFAMDLLLVPVHLGVHWCLAVVDFRKKTISYYDSMGGSNDEACRILLRYLKEESLDKRKMEFDVSGWVLGSKRSQDIPQQMNGSDCGMFTCKYADYISRDRPIRFSQKDMPYFRQLMAWELLHQKLL